MLTTLVAFFFDDRLIQYYRSRNNFDFAVVATVFFTQTYDTAMLCNQASFRKDITFCDIGFIFHSWLSRWRQVIDFTSQYPNPTFFTTSDVAGVTLTVFFLFNRQIRE